VFPSLTVCPTKRLEPANPGQLKANAEHPMSREFRTLARSSGTRISEAKQRLCGCARIAPPQITDVSSDALDVSGTPHRRSFAFPGRLLRFSWTPFDVTC
jgi:hypothetical protein